MWKVLAGVVVGIFVGAMAVEILKRRDPKLQAAGLGAGANGFGLGTDRVADVPPPPVATVPVGPFDVVLVNAGDNMIQLIREIRETMGIGIGEAKELAEAAPTTVAHAVDYKKAEFYRQRLESAGSSVEIKSLQSKTENLQN